MEKITILNATKFYLNELVSAGHARSTIDSYDTDLTQLRNFLLGKNIVYIDKIKVKHLSDYRSFMIDDKKFKSATVTRKMDVIGAFLNYLKNYDYIEDNPAKKLLKVKSTNNREDKLPRFLDYDEIDMIINAANNQMYGTRNAAILTTMAYTGCRRSDALNLDWADVDFFNKTLTVYRDKNNTEDSIPMHKALYDSLMKLYKHIRPNPNDPVFASDRGNRLSNTAFNQMFRKAVAESGVEKNFKITSHVFRHSFCTNLVKQGVSIIEIAEFTGHKDLESLKVYTHVSCERKQNIINSLPA